MIASVGILKLPAGVRDRQCFFFFICVESCRTIKEYECECGVSVVCARACVRFSRASARNENYAFQTPGFAISTPPPQPPAPPSLD